MQLIFKARNVKNPGAHGAHPWIDDKGNARYDEKPKGLPFKYIATVTLSDGSVAYVRPKADELDENHQVIGGAKAVREIMNRELFGDYGFDSNGNFWQKVGILFEYKTRTTERGKTVVDAIKRHEGYTSIELRDSSIERAYGDGTLPAKITKLQVEKKPRPELPSKEDKVEVRPHEDAHDQPLLTEIGVHNPPPRKPQTPVAVDVPMFDYEDPMALASAYLNASMNARKPSQAKTPEGQAKARAERKGQFEGIGGMRDIAPLPLWAINKFDSPAHLQAELSRGEGGHPLTTLITLGLWNPENRHKRFREQLVAEFSGFMRTMARRFGSVYSGTDAYRKFEGEGVDTTKWMRDRERDLFNHAVTVLLHEANTYVANDEPDGPDSRFDLKVKNAIKNELERLARDSALELGATALEDFNEEDAYHAPKTISPKEHFQLNHYGPIARKVLKEIVRDLPERERAAFESRLWLDENDVEGHGPHPDESHERRHAEARERTRVRRGRSAVHWGRPWIRSGEEQQNVAAMSDKLSDIVVTLRGGKQARLGELKPSNQKYYLEQWYNDAVEHIKAHLQNEHGGLTPDGMVVEKWLRLEAKVANINRKEVTERLVPPMAQMHLTPTSSTKPLQAVEHPAVSFFRTNQELARKLGVASKLDIAPTLPNVKAPTSQEGKLRELSTYHQLYENLQHPHIGSMEGIELDAQATEKEKRDAGAWMTTPHGAVEWHEGEHGGVVALHDAAVRLHTTMGKDEEAIKRFTSAANNLGSEHPMVKDYTRRIGLLGVDVPTSSDLASWKNRSHAEHREAQNRLHVVEFVKENKTVKKSANDLVKSFLFCGRAYDALSEAVFA